MTHETNSKMPVLFIGHGSPMNAIANNPYTQTLKNLGQNLVRPRAILCISAHWMTRGTWVTHMERPKTIHDFFGFPPELFKIQYPVAGDKALAEDIVNAIDSPKIHLDNREWGFDHGTWAVLKHMYPKADVPVLQLSLDMSQLPAFHFELGTKLRFLREQGVLILGSGNIVHNLGRIKWDENAVPFDWAVEQDTWVQKNLETRDFKNLVENFSQSEAGRLSNPTADHYYPLLYILGASDEKDRLKVEYQEIQNGSISMRSVSFGS